MTAVGLRMERISHAFGSRRVLNDVSLSVGAGELVCLLGPSGCGKTTLLRIAAGLERLQKGRVTMDGEPWADPERSLAPEHRRVGLVFQDFALFPHLTVAQNVAFGLEGMDRRRAEARVAELLDQVGLGGYAESYPHVLSGGQQQRVALARALAPEPRLMLLDEPFSGLDATMRVQIREESLSLLKARGVGTLMVTHDPEEAMFMADRIKVMVEGGRIVQTGSPADLYFRPADAYVAGLFGPVNRVGGVVAGGTVATELGRVAAPDMPDGTPVDVLVRPEGVIFVGEGATGAVAVGDLDSHLMGRTSHVRFSAGGGRGFQARVGGDFTPPPAGTELFARLDPRYTFIFPQS